MEFLTYNRKSLAFTSYSLQKFNDTVLQICAAYGDCGMITTKLFRTLRNVPFAQYE